MKVAVGADARRWRLQYFPVFPKCLMKSAVPSFDCANFLQSERKFTFRVCVSVLSTMHL